MSKLYKLVEYANRLPEPEEQVIISLNWFFKKGLWILIGLALVADIVVGLL